MPTQPAQWLAEQEQLQRRLLLIIDSVSAPDVVSTLFKLAPIHDYVRLFQGTEFEDLLEQSPWLIRIDSNWTQAITHLLQSPQRHWGWIASAQHLDLNEIAQHWRERMAFSEDNQRWFYRFQDNRIIAQHLGALNPQQISVLVGPLSAVLCWSGEQWKSFDNAAPAVYPAPFATPWLDIPEPSEAADESERSGLIAWLWEQHGEATQRLAEVQPLQPWLQQQLQRAHEWNWDTPEQKYFLLEHQLDPARANHPAWEPRINETPAMHFARCQRELLASNKGPGV